VLAAFLMSLALPIYITLALPAAFPIIAHPRAAPTSLAADPWVPEAVDKATPPITICIISFP